ncbi:hypothetical protein BWGOE4_31250 [Bacillus mycoides]|uniref:DUF5677 domain-containing protein n=1 Tax=Bacillus mycoides TaxID=1405 RepID=UPI000871CEE8|nr:DUF5677 domain-containing protein [Bacillus mycoides]OFD57536.1 hypothetical protein BWGOE4_31250 [Bacillus mycoides]OFD63791.1 hypothetical protein BWGOE7_30420 [Bacillus mycoides]OFD95012.1 hypothetical protein BWGOE12_31060 [Bacillus mycoides]
MKPNKSFLDRKENKEVQKYLNQMGRLVDEVVNYGTHILDYCSEKHEFTKFEIPIITSFSEFLSMLDGITILVKKGNGEAIKPIIRTLLEMKFNIEYMLKADEKCQLVLSEVERLTTGRYKATATGRGSNLFLYIRP